METEDMQEDIHRTINGCHKPPQEVIDYMNSQLHTFNRIIPENTEIEIRFPNNDFWAMIFHDGKFEYVLPED